jgi:hypothetical protein
VLFSERKRQEAYAAAEAVGDVLWTSAFSERARTRLWQTFALAFDIQPGTYGDPWLRICHQLQRDLLVGLGRERLVGILSPIDDVNTFLKVATDEEVCSVVEAMLDAWRSTVNWRPDLVFDQYYIADRINSILYEERLAYELVEGRIVERSSEELHTEVVVPTLRLLAGRVDYAAVEIAYRNALEEISGGKPDDAITDAATALQEMLELLGCEGNALGPLIRDARRKGVLAPHDQTLGDAIAKIGDWVSADRSEMGDGHRGASAATRDDAWLIVHIVGALVLRLASPPRGK